jgi:hypothetical protein
MHPDGGAYPDGGAFPDRGMYPDRPVGLWIGGHDNPGRSGR